MSGKWNGAGAVLQFLRALWQKGETGLDAGQDRRLLRAFALLCAVVSLLEIAACHMEIARIAASRLWFAGALVTAAVIAGHFAVILRENFRKRSWLELGLLACLLFLTCRVWGNIQLYDISYESALQVRDGLRDWASPGWNYTGKAFLSYPARQYLINALPTLLLGRSLLSLQLGYAVPFLLGILALYAGIRKRAVRYTRETALSVLPLFALFGFPYFAEYYLLFEQVITPVSYTMAAIGFFLLLTEESIHIADLFCLTWIGCLLPDTYTPSLASLALLMVFLALLCWKAFSGNGRKTVFSVRDFWKKRDKPFFPAFWRKRDKSAASVSAAALPGLGNAALLYAAAEITIVLHALISYAHNQTIHGVQQETGGTLSQTVSFLLNALTDQKAVFWGAFALIVWLWLVLSLSMRLTFRDFVLSVWVLGVIFSSLHLKGFVGGVSEQHLYHRMILVIPVIVTALCLHAFRLMDRYGIRIRKSSILCTALLLCFLMEYNCALPHPTSNIYKPPVKYLIASIDARIALDGGKNTDEMNFLFLSESPVGNFYDYSAYFYPRAQVYYTSRGGLENMDGALPVYLIDTQTLPDTVLDRAVRDVREETAYDPRWRQSFTWYCGRVESGQ